MSPDTPANLQPTVAKHELSYQLLSDGTMAAARAFGIAFVVPEETRTQYQKFGIDLEERSGQNHHLLPVPSVFILDETGKIVFEYVNPDYRVRIPAKLVLEATRTF